MKDHWQVWTQAVSSEVCDKIVEEGVKLKSEVGVMGLDLSRGVDLNYRSSMVGWFDMDEYSWITDIINRFAFSANRDNFGFDISYGANGLQFSSYSSVKTGRYDWHVDTFHNSTAPNDRKLSVCIQLSDPSTYQGGQFEFRGCDPLIEDVFAPKGSVLVFPSIFEHRVLPVTEGVRYSLVSWIDGPKWK